MRISDWSSDVCSSDLIAQRALGGAECREPRLAAQAAAGACEEEAGTMAEGLVCVLPCEQCGQSGPCEIKAPQRVLAPMALEFVPGLFEKRRGSVAAGIVDGNGKRGKFFRRCEKALDVIRSIGRASGRERVGKSV